MTFDLTLRALVRLQSWAQEATVPAVPAPTVEQVPAPVDSSTTNFVFDVLAPILSTGLIGALFLMILFRIKIMPTYVYDSAETKWDEERVRLHAELVDLKAGLKDANKVYTEQVIPTLTRVLDAERELVELRRDEAAERRRRTDGS